MSGGGGKKDVKPTREQVQAADPARSVWVMANAGSGKTHVLVNRVVRLLLAGFAPQSILCLTFTKAAAAEMSLRLFRLLASWIALDDEALAAQVRTLGQMRITPVDLARARRLFAIAIETPGGLKIQTIHAFCEKLLQLFPAESGIAPGFRVMDETERQQLLEEARNAALTAAAEADDLSLLDDGVISADNFEDLGKAFLSATSPFAAAVSGVIDPPDIEDGLRSAAHLDCKGASADILATAVAHDAAMLARAVTIFQTIPPYGSHKYDVHAALKAVSASKTAEDRLSALHKLAFTKDFDPRGSFFVAKTRAAHPEICAWIDSWKTHIVEWSEKYTLSLKIDATMALLRLMAGVSSAFNALKQERGLYDFDDLIMRTRELLGNSRAAQWVLYKLDAGLSHILVDEAQDTSPAQWDIIKALADEFFAGEGPPQQGPRSVFVVGDIKQSIYSFQGADTDAFAGARQYFREKTAGGGTPLDEIDLTISYRSLPVVLQAVDAVFAKGAPATAGLKQDERDGGHAANRTGEGSGTFELWPLFTKPEKPETDVWHAPVDRVKEESPRLDMARHVAQRIKGWIGQRQLAAKGRPVAPGDILILLQKRGVLFDALIAELRREGIPVAGADRLKLQENLAVMDVMALIQFCLLPEDDLSLACALKSPLVPVAFTEDDLTTIAAQRDGSLWQSLCRAGRHGETVSWITACKDHAVTAGPHGFIAQVLTNARRRIVARLGVEAEDATSMLLDTALGYERDHGTSLAAFLHWFTARDEDMKRELEGPAGEVRIMTVHGAKGLEGNIVILPDAADMPGPRNGPALLGVPGEGNSPALLPFFDAPTDIKPAAIRAWKDVAGEKSRDERKRLLYVAMTRARDELYIGGAQVTDKLDDDCWYNLVAAGLEASPTLTPRKIAGMHPAGDVMRHGDDPRPAASPGEATPETPLHLPDWALRPAPADSRLPPWASVTRVAARNSMVFDREAARQGLALHRVLEQLKDGDSVAAIALRLSRHGLDAAQAQALHGLLSRPDTAGFFAAEARSEAAIAGHVEGLPPVMGRIDRLRVDDAVIWLFDFKTGQPNSPARESHLRQMALYGAVLGAAFPGRRLRAALLWTHGMDLENLAESELSQCLEALRREHAAATA